MPARIKLDQYKTTQTSGDSTIDMYWRFVQYKYFNIVVCNDFLIGDIKDCISDANWGIRHCNMDITYYPDNKLIAVYKAQFQFIINHLEELNHE